MTQRCHADEPRYCRAAARIIVILVAHYCYPTARITNIRMLQYCHPTARIGNFRVLHNCHTAAGPRYPGHKPGNRLDPAVEPRDDNLRSRGMTALEAEG